MLNKSLFEANEHSSVLPSLSQTTPSNRENVSRNEGIGDRSDVGKKPVDGQSRIWGNLNSQSKGMTGILDTEGKNQPSMFVDHKNADGVSNTGTKTPDAYKKMLKESASGINNTGVASGKLKISGVSMKPSYKYVVNADTQHGHQVMPKSTGSTKSTVTESQKIGSALTIAALQLFNESANFKKLVKPR